MEESWDTQGTGRQQSESPCEAREGAQAKAGMTSLHAEFGAQPPPEPTQEESAILRTPTSLN